MMPTAKRVLVQLSRRHALEPERRMLCRSRAARARRGSTVAKLGCGHRYLVLVQQRAAPTLVCASKSQAWKHAKMCALSAAVGGTTVFTEVHSRTTRRFQTSALGCAVPTTWSMGRSRVALWRGSAGGPVVHDRPAFPVTTTPD